MRWTVTHLAFRVPPTARGDFVADFLLDVSAGAQTMIVAADNGRIEVNATAAGVLSTSVTAP